MPISLLILYCTLILAASLAGGWLPIFLRLTHRRLEMALSFVAGVILGVGLLHLIPHGFRELGSIDDTVRWVLVGFLAMFFVERFFSFHHHGPPDATGHDHDHDDGHHHHGHAHVHAAGSPPLPHGDDPAATHHPVLAGGQFAWIGAAIGLTLHGVIEGVALAAAVVADRHDSPAINFAGASTFLAIVLHKPFDSLTILTLMSASPSSTGRRHLVNALYAAVVPLGAAGYCLAAARAGLGAEALLGRALCFAAGTFLCIATSDLLPELQFHRHDRFKLSFALLLGIALAGALVWAEEQGHDQSHHDPAEGHDHAHDHAH